LVGQCNPQVMVGFSQSGLKPQGPAGCWVTHRDTAAVTAHSM
jgi:hypothetical protein